MSIPVENTRIGGFAAAQAFKPVGHVRKVLVAHGRGWQPVVPRNHHVFLSALDVGLSSWLPFSSTHFQRGLPSPPMLTRVAFLPMMRLKLSESLPKLVEKLTRKPFGYSSSAWKVSGFSRPSRQAKTPPWATTDLGKWSSMNQWTRSIPWLIHW